MARTKSNLYYLLFILFLISIASCQSDYLYNEYKEIDDGIWDADEPVVFYVDIQDTISVYNVFVNVRHYSNYEMQNLFLFIKTTAPGGAFVKDTFEIYLADEAGRWYGKGWGDIFDNHILYKRNIRFPQKGIYTFELIQAMRKEKLEHITDVGLSIKKIN